MAEDCRQEFFPAIHRLLNLSLERAGREGYIPVFIVGATAFCIYRKHNLRIHEPEDEKMDYQNACTLLSLNVFQRRC